jgi:tight adherence protein C
MCFCLLGFLGPKTVVVVSIFGFFAVGAWVLLDLFSSRKPRAEERLDHLKDPRGRIGKENAKTKDAMARVFEKAAPTLAAPLTPKSAKEQGKLRHKLDCAGIRGEGSAQVYMACKIVCALTGMLISGATSLATLGGFTINTLIVTLGGLIVGFVLPDCFVWLLGSRRKQAIFLGLPDALDLMVVCVEAGLGLDQAMRKVSEEMKKAHRVIAEEFSICNFQLQMGKERKDVLHQLGTRNGVDDLRSLASTIVQAEKFGSSVGKALRVQSETMRTKRRQIAEEKAAKTAVQLLFPLVIFIFPGIFVVLVGPAAITIIEEMLTM